MGLCAVSIASESLTLASSHTGSLPSPTATPFAHALPPLCVTMLQVGLRDSLLSSAVLLYRKMVAGGLKDVVLSPWEVSVWVHSASDCSSRDVTLNAIA